MVSANSPVVNAPTYSANALTVTQIKFLSQRSFADPASLSALYCTVPLNAYNYNCNYYHGEDKVENDKWKKNMSFTIKRERLHVLYNIGKIGHLIQCAWAVLTSKW